MRNPWLSLWMSGANAWTGAARGMMAGQARQAQSAMMAEAAKQQSLIMDDATKRWMQMWLPGAEAPARRGRKRRPTRAS